METKLLHKFKYVRNQESYMDEDKFDNLEVREEYIAKLQKIEKEPHVSFSSIEELEAYLESDEI